MKLYFAPGACSLTPHITLREAGLSFALERVNTKTRTIGKDRDYTRINPKGYVPALQFDDGTVLTEVGAMVQWIADQAPEKNLIPAPGTMERYHVAEWLSFVGAELHKPIGAQFAPWLDDNAKKPLKELALRRMGQAEVMLDGRPFVVGEHFSVADVYLFNIMNWTSFIGIDLARFPKLAEHHARVAARPRTHEAMKAEGLLDTKQVQ